VLLLFSTPATAHDGPHAPVYQPSNWDIATLAALAITGVLYAIGSARLRARGARVRTVEPVAFWIGWSTLVVAIAPPMDRAAASLFSVHMAQHELLMLVGAPLMIVGRPIVPWLWALPDALRPAFGTRLQTTAVTRTWRWLTAPVVAWALHGLAVWVWHVPALYEGAVRNEAVHAFQHATFVGTAVLFWWGLVYGRYGRAAYGASAFYVFITTVHTGILGAIFTLSRAPFYGIYAERAAGSGVDAVADQQLAGLYMWIPAGVVLTAFGLALIVAWVSESERRAAARPLLTLLVASVLAYGCNRIPHAEDARQITGGDPALGREKIRYYGCDSCHTIPGVPTADATVGPPLDRIAMRTLLAGHIQNTPENMMQWIRTPHAFEPQTAMPEMGVTERDSRDITAYLYTLR
jgi:putative membrane protein